MNDDEFIPEIEVAREGPEDTAIQTTPEPSTVGGGVDIPWGLAFFLVLSVLVVIFAVQNTQEVALNLFGWSGRFPLVVIIVSVFVAAVVLDEILGFVLRRRRKRIRAEREELKRLRSQQ